MQVLVAVEEPKSGEAIADFITHHCWPDDTQFYVINVIDSFDNFSYAGDPFYSQELAGLRIEREQRAQNAVGETAKAIKSAIPTAKITKVVVDGMPREAILQYADECKAEMIIIGSHGRSGLGRLFLGSVSLAILSQALCAVLVVRMPKTERAKESASQRATAAAV